LETAFLFFYVIIFANWLKRNSFFQKLICLFGDLIVD